MWSWSRRLYTALTEYSTMNAALSGTTLITGGDHDALAHLTYATAGHTGFQPTITTGTTAQYIKGDLSLGTLNQAAVAGLTTASSPTFAGLTVGAYTLPSTDGSNDTVLTTNGAGAVTWTTKTGGGGGGINTLNSQTGATQVFANDTNVTMSSATDTHTLGWTGQLAVARGGTGLATVTANSYLKGNGTSALVPRTYAEVLSDIGASPVAGSSSIVTVGTVGTGVWHGTAVGAVYGGTGQTSYTVGDILYAPTATTVGKLADVAVGSVLASGGVGGPPAYQAKPYVDTRDYATPQDAIDACLVDPLRPKMLLVTDRYTLTAPLMIDRQYDSAPDDPITTGLFRIVGSGKNAGFYTTSAINMFSTTLTYTQYPVSEGVSFENVQFEVDDPSLEAYVLDDNKFMRVKFTNCLFSRIKCLLTDQTPGAQHYTQSLYFKDNYIREWEGYWFTCFNAYDLSFVGNFVEWGGELLRLQGVASGVRVSDNLIEGLTGKSYTALESDGVDFSGNYLEGYPSESACPAPWVYFGNSYGVSHSGNFYAVTGTEAADATHYCVGWGNCYGATSTGNICNKNLFNPFALVGPITIGDSSNYGVVNSRIGVGLPHPDHPISAMGYVESYNTADEDLGFRFRRNKAAGSYNDSWIWYMPATSKNLVLYNTAGTKSVIEVVSNTGVIKMPVLPTSAAGLPSGALWNNGGVVHVA
jgi:hypothetical protein